MLFQSIRSRLKKEKGFTLLEMMIAIVILTFGILAVASMQVASIRGNFFAGNITEAKTWATNNVEQLRNVFYDNLASGSTTLAQAPQYTVSWVVTPNAVLQDTTSVALTVSWAAGLGRKSITLTEIIPRGL